MPAPPSISALSNGSGPPSGSSNTHSSPSRRALAGNGRAPRAVAGAGAQPDDRAQPGARLVDAAVERDLALGDDRDPLAQPLGVGDDVGRENDRRAGPRLAADQLLEPRLVDRVEPGEGLVEDDQPRLVDDRAEQLDGLRHALGQGADRLLRPVAKVVLIEQRVGAAAAFGERQAAQRAHEGDRLARMHRRIEPALLGQIADLGRGLERALAAEHAARAARRVDDPEQHAQGRRLARAVGAEQAVDRAGRDGEADAVDRAGLAEILDEIARFDREIRLIRSC